MANAASTGCAMTTGCKYMRLTRLAAAMAHRSTAFQTSVAVQLRSGWGCHGIRGMSSALSTQYRAQEKRVPSTTRVTRCVASASDVVPPPRSDIAKTRNADPEAACVLIGGSRGIGLALTQQLFSRFKGRIVALCRNPDEAGALSALFQFNPDRMRIFQIDTTDEASVVAAAKETKEFTGNRVDVLIHTVGILHDKREGGTGAMPETSLARLDTDFLQRNLMVNTVGPIHVFKHFSPMMTTTRKKDRVPSVLATLTARVGSIEDNSLGGWLSYRASKAAHNQALKTASVELGRRGVVCVALHPGTVDTDLSEPFQKNVPPEKLFPVDRAATMLLDVIDSLDTSDNGHFFDYARKPIPW